MVLGYVDDFLMDRIFQRFTEWFQELTGWSCYVLAQVCHVPWPLTIFYMAVNGMSAGPLWLDALIVALAVTQCWLWNHLEIKNRGSALRSINPMRPFWPMGAYRSLTLILIVGCFLWFDAPLIFTGVYASHHGPRLILMWPWLLSWYIGSCTPKPKSPLREGNTVVAH